MNPLSFSVRQARRLKYLAQLVPVVARRGDIIGALASARRVMRRDGLAGLTDALRRLHQQAYAVQAPPTPAAAPGFVYRDWVAQCDALSDDDRARIRAHVDAMPAKPLISVVLPVYNPEPKFLDAAIQSVLRQLYPRWELCIADDASTRAGVRDVIERHRKGDPRIKVVYRKTNGHICQATNSALALAHGEVVALLDHDDVLAEHALYWIAAELEQHPDADVIYSDSDLIDDSGRRFAPYFKSDFNLELMLGHNMVSHLGVYRRALVERLGGMRLGLEGSQDYDLLLRTYAASKPERVRHIPAVLYHWRRSDDAPSYSATSLDRCIRAAHRAVGDFLRERGIAAGVAPAPQARHFQRIVYHLPDPAPKVSVIIPTRNGADLLGPCIDSLLDLTDYPSLEVVIVDNDSDDPQTLALLGELAKRPGIRIVPHPGAFNYAAINNRAVAATEAPVLALLNNDVEITHPEWLREMVARALQPDVAAVGAKLFYPSGTIQHAGVVLGLGVDRIAGHPYADAPRDTAGSFGDILLAREVSAVTAACMVIRRSVFAEVGGFDEANLAVAYNDVDLCLRLRERGYRNIVTPFAEMMHRGSASRGADKTEAQRERLRGEIDYMRQRWGDALLHDPYFSPNFSLDQAVPDFARPPRVSKPWLRARA
jgi:glycosyltransferase involved in cell wall biosynthesis